MSKIKEPSNLVPSLNILATIVAIVVGFLGLEENFETSTLIVIITCIVIAFLIINLKSVSKLVKRLTARIQVFLNIVVEYRRGHLEFLDKKGNKAVYNEEVVLKKIRRKVLYSGGMDVEGRIGQNTYTYNCFHSLNQKRNNLTIVYGNSKKDDSIISNKRQLQFGFSVELNNTFPKEEESWEVRIKHYTKVYDLKVSFNKKNTPYDVDIHQVYYNEDGSAKLVKLPIDPLIIRKYNRVVMKVKLLHLKKDDAFRISWKWEK